MKKAFFKVATAQVDQLAVASYVVSLPSSYSGLLAKNGQKELQLFQYKGYTFVYVRTFGARVFPATL